MITIWLPDSCFCPLWQFHLVSGRTTNFLAGEEDIYKNWYNRPHCHRHPHQHHHHHYSHQYNHYCRQAEPATLRASLVAGNISTLGRLDCQVLQCILIVLMNMIGLVNIKLHHHQLRIAKYWLSIFFPGIIDIFASNISWIGEDLLTGLSHITEVRFFWHPLDLASWWVHHGARPRGKIFASSAFVVKVIWIKYQKGLQKSGWPA